MGNKTKQAMPRAQPTNYSLAKTTFVTSQCCAKDQRIMFCKRYYVNNCEQIFIVIFNPILHQQLFSTTRFTKEEKGKNATPQSDV